MAGLEQLCMCSCGFVCICFAELGAVYMEISSTSIPWFCPWYAVGLFSVPAYQDPLNFIPGYKNIRYTFMGNWK